MVSVRRRKLKSLVGGGKQGDQPGQGTGKGSSTPAPTTPGARVHEKCPPKDEHSNAHPLPLVTSKRSVAVEEDDELIPKTPAKKPNLHIQVDPENPMEVHTYLMKLKEDNKLDLGPILTDEKLPIKELMDRHYPHIFKVFPQDCKVLVQPCEKSRQLDLLYSQYWLFLYTVRNVISMDHKISPEFVKSFGDVINSLETRGFDCRFIRSELLVVGILIKQQLKIILARRSVIAARALNLENDLEAATTRNESDIEWNIQVKDGKLPEPCDKLQRDEPDKERYSPLFASIEEEYLETVLKQHKELLASTEAEAKRLGQVFERISFLLPNKSAISML